MEFTLILIIEWFTNGSFTTGGNNRKCELQIINGSRMVHERCTRKYLSLRVIGINGSQMIYHLGLI